MKALCRHAWDDRRLPRDRRGVGHPSGRWRHSCNRLGPHDQRHRCACGAVHNNPPTLGRTHHTGKVVVRDAPLSYAGDDFVLDANENATPDVPDQDTRTGRPTDVRSGPDESDRT